MRVRKPRSSPAPPHRRVHDSPQTTLGRSKAPPPQTFLTYPRRGGALLLPFSLSKKPRRVCARRRKESLNHFLRRHVRRRKYFSARKRASVSECAAASRSPFNREPNAVGLVLELVKNTFLTSSGEGLCSSPLTSYKVLEISCVSPLQSSVFADTIEIPSPERNDFMQPNEQSKPKKNTARPL